MENPIPRTFDAVFNDFKGRRAGLIRALTTEKDHLCLYGHPDEMWEVSPPAEEVPSELPEPVLGINFARDGMQDKDWLALVAVHGDTWLLSVAFYFGARIGFGKNERKKLFGLINDLPSIYEIVAGIPKQPKEQSGAHNSKSKSGGETTEPQTEGVKTNAAPKEGDSGEERDAEEEEDEQGATTCGACGGDYAADEFWICCDMCEMWFHGKCVKITPAKAEHIRQYKCPACSNKKARV